MSFCVWLTSLSIMSSGFTHVVACVRSVLLFHVQPFFSLSSLTAFRPTLYTAFTRPTLPECRASLFCFLQCWPGVPDRQAVCSHSPHPFLCMCANSVCSLPKWNCGKHLVHSFLVGTVVSHPSPWLRPLLPLADRCFMVSWRLRRFCFSFSFGLGMNCRRKKK